MKKQFFLVVLLAVFSLVLAEQNAKAQNGEGISTYSTVNYNSTNNSVTGHSYTYATYGNSGYYKSRVTSFLADSDDNVLDSEIGYGNLNATALLYALGRGCDEYRILSSHRAEVQYYVTAFYYNGGLTDGYYDPFNYLTFQEQGDSYPLPDTNYFPGFTMARVLDFNQIILGSTQKTSVGNCLIPQIDTVEFEQIPGVAPGGSINEHPAINGLTSSNKGKRIYPDKETPGETGTNRTKVRIKVAVIPATGGIPIYFKSYDLDDPSSNSAPLDTTDTSGAGGNDNKGSVGGKTEGDISASPAITDSFGFAYQDLTVTRNPGDNFAVAVSKRLSDFDDLVVDGVELKRYGHTVPVYKASNPPPRANSGDPVMRTELLTVWRRLHIELDSMGIVSGNSVTGTFSGNQTIAASGNTTLSLNVSPDLEANRFENGRLVLNRKSGGSFTVIDHTATLPTDTPSNATINVANTTNTVTVSNTTGIAVSISNLESFILYDDDDMNGDDGVSLDGDASNENVGTPDTDILQAVDTPCTDVYTTSNCNVFASAYVMPKYDLTGSLEDVPFQLNIDQPALTSIYSNSSYFDNVGTEASIDFWTVYLLGSYQHTINSDSDPDEASATSGATYGRAEALSGGKGAAVFIELARAREYQEMDRWITLSWQNRPIANRFTTAHELGHLFGAEHTDNVSGNAGLMRQSSNRTGAVFTEISLNKIRGGTGVTNP